MIKLLFPKRQNKHLKTDNYKNNRNKKVNKSRFRIKKSKLKVNLKKFLNKNLPNNFC
jgi:hypothetical protein